MGCLSSKKKRSRVQHSSHIDQIQTENSFFVPRHGEKIIIIHGNTPGYSKIAEFAVKKLKENFENFFIETQIDIEDETKFDIFVQPKGKEKELVHSKVNNDGYIQPSKLDNLIRKIKTLIENSS